MATGINLVVFRVKDTHGNTYYEALQPATGIIIATRPRVMEIAHELKRFILEKLSRHIDVTITFQVPCDFIFSGVSREFYWYQKLSEANQEDFWDVFLE